MFKGNLRRPFVQFTGGEVKSNASKMKMPATSSVIWGDFTYRRLGLALCPLLVCCLLLISSFAKTTTTTATTIDSSHNGLALLAKAPARADGSFDGIATFGGVMPSATQVDGLKALGLRVQSFQNLPLALLRGPQAAMFDAVSRGFASDVYPNEKLQFFSNASNIAINVDKVQALGVNGEGVGIAIVDSGIDATHPDLMNRVTHNVKIVTQDGQVTLKGPVRSAEEKRTVRAWLFPWTKPAITTVTLRQATVRTALALRQLTTRTDKSSAWRRRLN